MPCALGTLYQSVTQTVAPLVSQDGKTYNEGPDVNPLANPFASYALKQPVSNNLTRV
jgi:hypothetical protein